MHFSSTCVNFKCDCRTKYSSYGLSIRGHKSCASVLRAFSRPQNVATTSRNNFEDFWNFMIFCIFWWNSLKKCIFHQHVSTLSAISELNIAPMAYQSGDIKVAQGSCAHFPALRMSLRPLETILENCKFRWFFAIFRDFSTFPAWMSPFNPLYLPQMLLRCCFSKSWRNFLQFHYLQHLRISHSYLATEQNRKSKKSRLFAKFGESTVSQHAKEKRLQKTSKICVFMLEMYLLILLEITLSKIKRFENGFC